MSNKIQHLNDFLKTYNDVMGTAYYVKRVGSNGSADLYCIAKPMRDGSSAYNRVSGMETYHKLEVYINGMSRVLNDLSNKGESN